MKTNKCPVCGKEINEGGMIFHFRKKAVFEIYEWYLDRTKLVPHQDYIENNSETVTKFTI